MLTGPGRWRCATGSPPLKTALLRRGYQGAPDSLQLGFSESIRPIASGTAFPACSPTGVYASPWAPAPSCRPPSGRMPGSSPIVARTDASARPAVPAAGDSVWIHCFPGLSDSVGNVQSNPANVRVPLRIRTLLTWNIKPPDSTGVARLPSGAQGPQWSVYAGNVRRYPFRDPAL